LKIQPLKISILDKYPKKFEQMKKEYYNPEDLKKFSDITQWNKELGDRFFEYYNKVFEEGELSAREKSLIALAVAHVVQCPYCIDAYTKDGLQRGIEKEEMMEASPCRSSNQRRGCFSARSTNDESSRSTQYVMATKSLKARKSALSKTEKQLEVLSNSIFKTGILPYFQAKITSPPH
jgi:alkylhydroperoxidase/carboxymuconolactone decarboxylase family protein